MSRRARNLFRLALQSRPQLSAQVPAVVWKKEWIVNTQAAGSGEKALGHLAGYVQRTALSSQRVVKEENGRTTFKYRQSDTETWKVVRLDTPEFLRRFLQHVLPSGFHRVRYFGWWSPAAKTKWARILALLDGKEPARPLPRPAWIKTCPCCGKPMQRPGMLPRAPPRGNARPIHEPTSRRRVNNLKRRWRQALVTTRPAPQKPVARRQEAGGGPQLERRRRDLANKKAAAAPRKK